MTIDEANLYTEEARKAELNRFKEYVTLAHAAVGWSKYNAKHFPKIDDILKKIDGEEGKTKQQSAKDMLEIVKQLNARFGGT